MKLLLGIFAIYSILLIPCNAYAYIGPGAGLSALGSMIGLFASMFLTFIGILWYPLKKMFSRSKAVDENENVSED